MKRSSFIKSLSALPFGILAGNQLAGNQNNKVKFEFDEITMSNNDFKPYAFGYPKIKIWEDFLLFIENMNHFKFTKGITFLNSPVIKEKGTNKIYRVQSKRLYRVEIDRNLIRENGHYLWVNRERARFHYEQIYKSLTENNHEIYLYDILVTPETIDPNNFSPYVNILARVYEPK